MKSSIAAKIFAMATGLFILILLIQWFVISRSFNDLYFNSILSSMQKELSAAVDGYDGGSEEDSFRPLREYASKTGSPILVLTDRHELADRDFLYKMDVLQVELTDGSIIHVPSAFVAKLSAEAAEGLIPGEQLQMKLVRVGNSSFYEPLTLTIAGVPYTNRTSMREYTVVREDIPKLEASGRILFHRNSNLISDTQNKRTELIYDGIKHSLITRGNIENSLNELCGREIDENGGSYHFFYETRSSNDTTYFFLTAQKIVVTGFEKAYISSFFYSIYAVLGLILIVAAYILARRLSRPLIHLSRITEKIAHLDFSQAAPYQRSDELGQLSDNINQMSSNLKSALQKLNHSNEELQRTTQLSKENEKRMELLLADLAHEFKTPLGLISGFIEVIQRGINENEPEYYLNIISDEVSQLTDMVNEAIELTKLQSGHWSIHLGDHSFADIATSVLIRFEKRMENQGFTLKTSLTESTVRADPHRIDQVLSNFLSNALKYSGSEKTIEVTSELQSDGVFKVLVGNSGSIAPETLRRIWQRDYSVDEGLQLRLPSQGIGLDIARSILEAHRSEFGVIQQNGMVYFYFTLLTC